MVRLSNTLIGILNAVTFLLSVPILGGGIWLRTRTNGTECAQYLTAAFITIGVILMLVSVAGLVGTCCHVTYLLWFYLVAMFILIVVLFGYIVFAFVVTNKGPGEAVSDRGIKEYNLGDYSGWMQRWVENNKNWNRIRSCLVDGEVCKAPGENYVFPIQTGCCEPPTSCGFTFVNDTQLWTGTPTSTAPDCTAWDAAKLCYDCQSCKASVVATLRRVWKGTAILNIIFLILIIIVYSVACCAFRNNRRDNRHAGYKQGIYA